MILVDTSVWVDHLRRGDATLARLLEDGEVLMHSFVVGELACGNLHNRPEILQLLGDLPHVEEATSDEALYCVEENALMGRGVGWVDVHLLASALLELPSEACKESSGLDDPGPAGDCYWTLPLEESPAERT